MNANGLRFWGLTEARDWLPPQSTVPLEYTPAGRLRLKSTRVALAPKEDQEKAQARLQLAPQSRDTLGSRAFLEPASGQIMATGAVPGKISIYTPPQGQKVTDFALGYDGIFYIAVGGDLVLQDKRKRWGDATLVLEGFNAHRLTPDPRGGVWVINAEGNKLGRVEGAPLPEGPRPAVAPGVMRPVEENPNPPRLSRLLDLPGEETFVAISSSPGGQVALLSWVAGGPARLRMLAPNSTLAPARSLLAGETDQAAKPIQLPYSIAFFDEDNVAVLVTGLTEVLVYKLEDLPELLPVGDVFPLAAHTGGPFLHGLDLPPHYPTGTGSAEVCPISYRSFVGDASTQAPRIIDSGRRQTEWHRLYMEAVIPSRCGIKIFLAASDTPIGAGDQMEWFEHRFGQIFPNPPKPTVPTGAWERQPSELPFHPGLLGNRPREANKSGLFTVLVQRAGKVVRALRGRYLGVRVELLGDGLTTPEIASLRVYASRFSFVRNYLPELFHETVFAPESEQGTANSEDITTTPSTPADFLERFVNNFEGVLTEVEDRVAASYLLTRAASAQEDALPWLASWIGLSFDPAFPKQRRRDLLQAAPGLFERRGTLAAMNEALDVATGGMASNGSIVVVEEFHLRRTFATILGANLENDADPLLPGLSSSANSYVGDTLFLGDEHRKEFLALFGPQVLEGMSAREKAQAQEAIWNFYERLAHRITVLVHNEVLPQNFALINRVVQLEKPAHVIASVQRATYPFLVGIASLLGLDTYMRNKPEPQPVRVDVSRIGGYDVVRQIPSLDPRFEGGNLNASQAPTAGGTARVQVLGAVAPKQAEAKPVAHIDAPPAVRPGHTIRLDASASEAPLGRKIVKYRWTLIQKKP